MKRLVDFLYVLKNKKPVKMPNVLKWATWLENAGESRVVQRDKIGRYIISTVFLAIDQNIGKGKLILWETMVFGAGKLKGKVFRCSGSIRNAEAMHKQMVFYVQSEIKRQKVPAQRKRPAS